MHFSLLLVAFAMIALLTPTVLCSAAFTTSQVASAPKVHRRGPAALASLYNKYGVQVPESLAKVAAAQVSGQTGSSRADLVDYEIMYATLITIGGQEFNMQFDTGSSAV